MFVSTTTNNLDAKGRVSVPADFRANVDAAKFDGVVLWPSLHKSCIEGACITLFEGYLQSLDDVNEYDPGREAVLLSILGESRRLGFDGGGRVTLPKEFVEFAGLSDKATFVGLGWRFEVWEPEAHAARVADARKLALEHTHLLKPASAFRREGAV